MHVNFINIVNAENQQLVLMVQIYSFAQRSYIITLNNNNLNNLNRKDTTKMWKSMIWDVMDTCNRGVMNSVHGTM